MVFAVSTSTNNHQPLLSGTIDAPIHWLIQMGVTGLTSGADAVANEYRSWEVFSNYPQEGPEGSLGWADAEHTQVRSG